MNRNDWIDSSPSREEKKSAAQGSLLLQFALIGSGRISDATEEMQAAARGMVAEVIDAARRTGCSMGSLTNEAPFSTDTVYALFDWLDAVCSAAGSDAVEEIFTRPKPQYLQ